MYTKQEISKQKQRFWTAFGRYMKPVLSADGEEISWPAIISFLKPRIIALDGFWGLVRDNF